MAQKKKKPHSSNGTRVKQFKEIFVELLLNQNGSHFYSTVLVSDTILQYHISRDVIIIFILGKAKLTKFRTLLCSYYRQSKWNSLVGF